MISQLLSSHFELKIKYFQLNKIVIQTNCSNSSQNVEEPSTTVQATSFVQAYRLFMLVVEFGMFLIGRKMMQAKKLIVSFILEKNGS